MHEPMSNVQLTMASDRLQPEAVTEEKAYGKSVAFEDCEAFAQASKVESVVTDPKQERVSGHPSMNDSGMEETRSSIAKINSSPGHIHDDSGCEVQEIAPSNPPNAAHIAADLALIATPAASKRSVWGAPLQHEDDF